jgi:hypothetical protein
MPQHDFNVANQNFPSFREDLNKALEAMATQSSGNNEPLVTYPYQIWVDTQNGLIKMRNAANNAWLTTGRTNQPFWGLKASDVGATFVAPYFYELGTSIPLIRDTSGSWTDLINQNITINSGCRFVSTLTDAVFQVPSGSSNNTFFNLQSLIGNSVRNSYQGASGFGSYNDFCSAFVLNYADVLSTGTLNIKIRANYGASAAQVVNCVTARVLALAVY